LVGAALLPGVASADSVVYLKGGNVWIANADGTGARQFTLNNYNWVSPSEADDGTVVVAGGLQRVNPDGSDSSGSSEIYRFQPDGNQIGTFTPTYGSYSTPACPTYGPSRVRVSPDGSKIAYGIYGCGAGGYETALWTPAGSTTLNFPNQSIGQQDFWNPIWIDSSRFTISHFGPPFGAHWGEHLVSDGDNEGGGWYESTMDSRAADAVISRDGTTAVVFFEDSASYSDGMPRNVSMLVYHDASVPSDWTHNAYGSPACSFTLDASKFSNVEKTDPSLSPDGTKVMWGDDDGVELMSLGDVTSNCSGHSSEVTLIPGGSEPFYSKGNLQPGAANPVQPGGATATAPAGGTPTGGAGGSATHPAKPRAKFALATKKSKLRVGKKIVFDARKSGESGGKIVSYRWKFGDGKKASGRKVTHRYRRKGTYTVTLTVVDAQGHKATMKMKVRIRR
jgi:hypothetical protein